MPSKSRTSDHSAITEDVSKKRLVDLLRDVPAATFRFTVHQEFGVPFWDGVDQLTADAARLFSNIPPGVFTFTERATQEDVFKRALMVCMYVMRAASEGREDLSRCALSLQTGLLSFIERKQGFEEPFFRRGVMRSRSQPRETLYVRKAKSVAAEACEALKIFGFKDAARQVAAALNKCGAMPIKSNGKAVVPRSILNWHSRLRFGDLKFVWLQEREGRLFADAYKLWRSGRKDAARRRVLQLVPIYIEDESLAVDGN
jgi:hypothetical protein